MIEDGSLKSALLILIFAAEPVDAIDLVEVPVHEEVELVDEGMAGHPVAFIQSVSLFEEEDHRAHGLVRFPHIFGASKVVDKDADGSADPDQDYVLKPLSEPLSVVKVILDPVKEANKLLPEQLDPFHGDEAPITDEERQVEEEARKAKLRQQQLLLNTGSGSNFNSVVGVDSRWHFQVQAGGSFRQGNNPSTNITTQLRAERHTLSSDFTSRFGPDGRRAEPSRLRSRDV